MKFRKFQLKRDITQSEYVTFRTKVEEKKPAVWGNIRDLPAELFYYVLVVSAVEAGFVEDVTEKNEYEEEVTWAWNIEYVDNLPADGSTPIAEWGSTVFDKWVEIRTLDPN